MNLRSLLLIILVLPVYSLTDSEKVKECVIELKDNKRIIESLGKLNKKQIETVSKFLDSGIKSELSYQDNIFTIHQYGEFPVYELQVEKGDYVIKDHTKFKYNKTTTYKFNGKGSPRPYPYLPAIFKLGGGVFYNQVTNSAYPDFALLFEVISFDKLIGLYGVSLNVSGGLRHVGVSFGYQLHNTILFRNTSIIFGYAHDFTAGFQTPYLGVSLNF